MCAQRLRTEYDRPDEHDPHAEDVLGVGVRRDVAVADGGHGREHEVERQHVPEGRTTRGDQGHLVLRECIASQSEVIRAILVGS